MNDEGKIPQGLFTLPMKKEMAIIGPAQGLPLMRHSRMMRTTTINVETGAHPPKVWEMMQ